MWEFGFIQENKSQIENQYDTKLNSFFNEY